MAWKWGMFSRRSGNWLAAGWLAAAAVAALYLGFLEPRQRYAAVAEQKTAGLAWQPRSAWHQEGLLGGVASLHGDRDRLAGYLQTASLDAAPAPQPASPPDDSERRLVRTASFDLVVQHPAESAEKVRAIAERLGGYLETSQVSGDSDSPSASLTIRVPAARFEEARAEIRKLGLRIDDERLEADDVTKQYVDQQARLRNLRAEEVQYLAILKHAATVKDTLEVSEKLNQVRSEIEQQQAEFDALTKQTETVAITVSLRAEADAQVFGLRWRPLYRLKTAARDGLDKFGDYLAAMAALAFYLPTLLLWMATFLIAAALGWRMLRWSWRRFFALPNSATTEREVH